MASSLSASFDAHRFRSPYDQSLFEEHIAGRGWKRLTNPRMKISKLLIQEFYANAVRTKEEIVEAEAHPYKSYVRGVKIDFSSENIKQILRIRDHTPGAESDFETCQRNDQRLDEVI
ncbi:hypothetical protein PIB30_087048 [Stylosanthes scabra]|uniref:Putative plant transposon protein domain-containing protein n=1 Tax=Stylosanthes scabra TaxID=79078 RepID=A0ABU6XV27_9FABA|nr:hypothetical protein [Stylosanthes scabra]